MSVIFGTSSVEVAPIKPDGSMPLETAFTELCKTYKNSVEIVDQDPTTTEEYSDQSTEPIAAFVEAGKTEGKFSGYEYAPETLTKLLGGTVVDNEWMEGDNMGQEVALRFKTDSGHQISYPKVKLFGKKNLKLQKNAIALIDCTFTPLSKARIKKLP